MANTLIKASFTICVTTGEAELLRKAWNVADLLANNEIIPADRAKHFEGLNPAFTTIFPPSDDDPFSGFLEIFDDPHRPSFDSTLELNAPDSQRREASIYGDHMNINAVAELILRVCKSALPYGFEYALEPDRLRPGDYGGGYVAISHHGIEHGGTSDMLARAIARTRDEGCDGFVLAIRDREDGLSFWNAEAGFDRLARATVFSEEEVARFQKPIADDESAWLALPAPLKL